MKGYKINRLMPYKTKKTCPHCGHSKAYDKGGKTICTKCKKHNKGLTYATNKHNKKILIAVV